MTVTSRKVQANRENAQKSTGPKSVEGKQRSSRNATAPPLESLLLPPESFNRDYTIILLELQEDLAPRGVMQGMLVERIASLLWKIRRLQQAEEHLTRVCADASIRGKRLALKDDDPESMLDELGEHDRKHFESILDDTPADVLPQAWYCAALAADARQMVWMQKYELQLQRTLHAALREWHRLRKSAAQEEAVAEEDLDLADLLKSNARSTRLAHLYEAEIADTFRAYPASAPASGNEPEQPIPLSPRERVAVREAAAGEDVLSKRNVSLHQAAPGRLESPHPNPLPEGEGTRPISDGAADGHLPDLEALRDCDSDDEGADPPTPFAYGCSDAAAVNRSSEEKTIKNEAKVKMEKMREEESTQARSLADDLP